MTTLVTKYLGMSGVESDNDIMVKDESSNLSIFIIDGEVYLNNTNLKLEGVKVDVERLIYDDKLKLYKYNEYVLKNSIGITTNNLKILKHLISDGFDYLSENLDIDSITLRRLNRIYRAIENSVDVDVLERIIIPEHNKMYPLQIDPFTNKNKNLVEDIKELLDAVGELTTKESGGVLVYVSELTEDLTKQQVIDASSNLEVSFNPYTLTISEKTTTSITNMVSMMSKSITDDLIGDIILNEIGSIFNIIAKPNLVLRDGEPMITHIDFTIDIPPSVGFSGVNKKEWFEGVLEYLETHKDHILGVSKYKTPTNSMLAFLNDIRN